MLELVLLIAFGGAILTYLLGKISFFIRDFFAVCVSGALLVAMFFLYGSSTSVEFHSGFMGFPLLLRINAFAWYFAVTIAVVGFLATIFSLSYVKGKDRTSFYYLMMLLVNAGMIGIVFSGDLVSFFIFWEIMSWSTFLLISYNRGPALAAGMQYMIMSLIGSAAYLIAALSLYANYGTLVISELFPFMASASPGYVLFLLILFFIAFGVKNAVWPLHTWLPPAHSEAPSPFSAVLSGILVRMGMYGFLLVFNVVMGIKLFLGQNGGVPGFHYVLAWIGAINIVIPTFIAMLQNDSKRLLAWHGVGQGGYMVLGIALGTSLGVTGGTFHIINHTSYIALLFLVVGAVEYRTGGVRDLNSLGGLIKRMPIVFIGALVGTCGLIGIPLTNGFVSKWLIYKALILEGHPFLAFAALIGTWGTILSLYKFLHNMFLGQLPAKYADIKEAPFSMTFPIGVLSLIIIAFGVFPGIPLKVINSFLTTSFGLGPLDVNIWGIASETGTLNTVNLAAALLASFAVVWLIVKAGRAPVRVSQDDTYAAGAAIPKERYQYTVDFYNPLYRMIVPYLRDFVDMFYSRLAGAVRDLCGVVRKIYSGYVGDYVMYIVLFLAFLIFIQLTWGPW